MLSFQSVGEDDITLAVLWLLQIFSIKWMFFIVFLIVTGQLTGLHFTFYNRKEVFQRDFIAAANFQLLSIVGLLKWLDNLIWNSTIWIASSLSKTPINCTPQSEYHQQNVCLIEEFYLCHQTEIYWVHQLRKFFFSFFLNADIEHFFLFDSILLFVFFFLRDWDLFMYEPTALCCTSCPL